MKFPWASLNMRQMTSDSISQALAAADRLCLERGERMTPVRRHVLELVLQSNSPVKAYDLLESLKPGPGSAKPPTVYRALDFLMSLGLVHKIEALNAFVGCTHSHACGGAELYICTDCGHVQEVHGSLEPGHKPKGFKVERSVVEHFGVCGNCHQ